MFEFAPVKKLYRAVHGQSPRNKEVQILRNNDTFIAEKGGEEIVLPERLGKSLYVAHHLQNSQAGKEKQIWGTPKDFKGANLHKYDCHMFVAYGLGLLKSFALAKTFAYTAHHPFFPREAYVHYNTLAELQHGILTAKSPILVMQQKNKYGDLKHSAFVLTFPNGQIYLTYKDGKGGGQFMEPLNENQWQYCIEHYGQFIAIDTYEHVSSRSDLQQEYKKIRTSG